MDLIRGLAGLAYWMATLGGRPEQHDQLSEVAVTDGKLRSVTPKVLALMSVTMILGLLAVGTVSDHAVLNAAATLTEIAEEQLDDAAVGEALHQRAVVLYDLGSTEDRTHLASHRGSATLSAEAIDALPLPAEVRSSLIRVLDRLGHLARAEDHLFELVWADAGAAWDLGHQLYAAWQTLSDDALVAGGLERAELSSGLADLRVRAQPSATGTS